MLVVTMLNDTTIARSQKTTKFHAFENKIIIGEFAINRQSNGPF